MTSNTVYREAYVWIWLPGAADPVVAGLLTRVDNRLAFNYGRSYLARRNAISIYEPELPLKAGALPLMPGLSMPSSYPRRIARRLGPPRHHQPHAGTEGKDIDPAELDELTYLLESGSDRTGALDFQTSATDYMPRQPRAASLDELLKRCCARREGVPLTPELDQALLSRQLDWRRAAQGHDDGWRHQSTLRSSRRRMTFTTS